MARRATRSTTLATRALAAWLCVGAALAQDASTPAGLLKRFDALPEAAQQATLDAALLRIAAIEDATLQRIAAYGDANEAFPPMRERVHHEPSEFAPVAPKRQRIARDDARTKKVRVEFPHVRLLRDLAPSVAYDWLHGEAALAPVPLTVRDRFANLCAGYPPTADRAVAKLLAVLDRDADQREIANWSEHAYADRDGRVFDGITLYEAWYSGRTVEVPDVDAIAFARRILETEAFVSPIPDGKRRDRLYEQIRATLKKHREYRTLCESAAAAFVAAEPLLDPTYQPLVDRMQLLWSEHGHDPASFAKQLTESDRAELLKQIDERGMTLPDSFTAMRESKQQKQAMKEAIRAACTAALDEAEKAKQ